MPKVGARVTFQSTGGKKFSAKLTSARNISSGRVEVLIDGDPFPTEVPARQVCLEGAKKPMTTTKTAKELRNEARSLGVAGYEDMTKAELQEAVSAAGANGAEPAKRKAKKKASSTKAKSTSTAKKAPTKAKAKTAKKATSKKTSTAKKGAAKKATTKKTATKKAAAKSEGTPDNPFRQGTNLYHITEALKKGGKRSTLTKQLQRKLSFNPRKQSEEDFDVEAEIDRRLKVVGYILKNQHGWTYEHEGRGPSAKIKVTPPS